VPRRLLDYPELNLGIKDLDLGIKESLSLLGVWVIGGDLGIEESLALLLLPLPGLPQASLAPGPCPLCLTCPRTNRPSNVHLQDGASAPPAPQQPAAVPAQEAGGSSLVGGGVVAGGLAGAGVLVAFAAVQTRVHACVCADLIAAILSRAARLTAAPSRALLIAILPCSQACACLSCCAQPAGPHPHPGHRCLRQNTEAAAAGWQNTEAAAGRKNTEGPLLLAVRAGLAVLATRTRRKKEPEVEPPRKGFNKPTRPGFLVAPRSSSKVQSPVAGQSLFLRGKGSTWHPPGSTTVAAEEAPPMHEPHT